MHPPSSQDLRAYYSSALAGLRFVETRSPTGRRFGADADARWAHFHGELTAADRIDLLLRDASIEWPGAFGGDRVFSASIFGDDEAFGPHWVSLEPIAAEDLWRSATHSASCDLEDLLSAWSHAWGASLAGVDVGPLSTADRLVVAGPSAVAAALRSFIGRRDLAWSEQVTVVATPPAHRQLATFATAILNETKLATIVTPARINSPGGRTLVSPDALPEDAAAALGSAG